jgi:ubiquinone/menaquinone biosynthesis C-methylase UbiE
MGIKLGGYMPGNDQVLSTSAAQAYYDRFGKKQDSQGFYEDPALDEMIAHAGFQDARSIFEFGCGTGKLAARLLEKHSSSTVCYLGCDISPVMIGLAKRRLEEYVERAKVVLSDGAVQFPLPDHSVDRVVSSYVLDLLSEADIRRFFLEARRTLTADGKLCIASLTRGVSLPSRIVSSLWTAMFNLSPAMVGGCRPIDLDSFVDIRQWRVVHRRVLAPYGVPSEVFILEAEDMPCNGLEPTPLRATAQSERNVINEK